jgi:hypothetical protein
MISGDRTDEPASQQTGINAGASDGPIDGFVAVSHPSSFEDGRKTDPASVQP